MSCVYLDDDNKCSSNAIVCDDNKKKKCNKLYNNYKKICEIAKPLDRCENFDISNLTLTELEQYIKNYTSIYNNYLKCYDARMKHREKCIHSSCIDEGHQAFLDRLQSSMASCKKIMLKINTKISDELKEIERKKHELRKKQEELDREKEKLIKSEEKVVKLKKEVKKIEKITEIEFTPELEKETKEYNKSLTPDYNQIQLKYIKSFADFLEDRINGLNNHLKSLSMPKLKKKKWLNNSFSYWIFKSSDKNWIDKIKKATKYNKGKTYIDCGDDIYDCLLFIFKSFTESEILDVILTFRKILNEAIKIEREKIGK